MIAEMSLSEDNSPAEDELPRPHSEEQKKSVRGTYGGRMSIEGSENSSVEKGQGPWNGQRLMGTVERPAVDERPGTSEIPFRREI